jgi:hypothetical protein
MASGLLRNHQNFLAHELIDFRVKGRIHAALYLSIPLYVYKIRRLREDLLDGLYNFHYRCVRTIRRMTIAHLSKSRQVTDLQTSHKVACIQRVAQETKMATLRPVCLSE